MLETKQFKERNQPAQSWIWVPFITIYFQVNGQSMIWDHTISANNPDYGRVIDIRSATLVVSEQAKIAPGKISIVAVMRSPKQ